MEPIKEVVTEEELSKLRTLNSSRTHARDVIADIEIRINMYQNQKQSFFKSHEEAAESLSEYEEEMKKKYGDNIAINMQNGEISRTSD